MAVPAQKPLDAILPLAVFYNMCPLTVNAGAIALKACIYQKRLHIICNRYII